MDLLAVIAIGTEPYNRAKDAVTKRIGRRDKFTTVRMRKAIIAQAIYQILVMAFFMYFGGIIFYGGSINLITTPLRDKTGKSTGRIELDTMLFHTFVLMNCFNMINCRVLDGHPKLIFKNLMSNPLLWIIIAIIMAAQHLMFWFSGAWFFSALLGVAPFSIGMNIVAWVFAAGSLGINFAVDKFPDAFADKVGEKLDLIC